MSKNGDVTLGELLARSARRVPNKTAIVFGRVRLSYRELNAQANSLANALLALGVKKGTKVALLSRNNPEFVVSHFAIAKSGGVLVPINFWYTPRELEYVVNDCDAEVLGFSHDLAPVVEAARSNLGKVAHFICIGPGGERAISYNELIRSYPPTEPEVDVGEEDDYSIIYTSGTTGRPKGALATHRARVEQAIHVLLNYHISESAITLQPHPLFHLGGLNTCMVPHILVGATVILMDHMDVPEWVEIVERERVNTIFSAPVLVHTVLEWPELDQHNLDSIEWWLYGGAPMTLADLRELMRRFPKAKVIQAYGSTEACQLTVLDWQDQERKAGATGRVCIMSELRVVDEAGRDVAPGQVGEIVTRGKFVMKEYYKRPEATAEAFRDGWFHMGDLARIDEEGFVTVIDRKTDMIISGAENIYPKEIEEVLYQHPAVLEAAVFGIPDETWGESVCATIVLRPGVPATEQEIIDYCKEHLATYKKPKVVRFVESMPKGFTGKIKKHELREPYWRGRDRRV